MSKQTTMTKQERKQEKQRRKQRQNGRGKQWQPIE